MSKIPYECIRNISFCSRYDSIWEFIPNHVLDFWKGNGTYEEKLSSVSRKNNIFFFYYLKYEALNFLIENNIDFNLLVTDEEAMEYFKKNMFSNEQQVYQKYPLYVPMTKEQEILLKLTI